MKAGILPTLMFIAAASLLVEVNGDDDGQMCPHEYLKKHPETFKKMMKMMKEKGSSFDFSKLASCSESQKCPENRICCHTPCGMKCTRPVTEENAEETLKLIQKDVERQVSLEPYVETEEDKKFGMCPENYLKTHPEFKEKMHDAWKNKHHKHNHDGQCKGGKECAGKHKKKFGKHVKHYADKPTCSVDGDCLNQMRCCDTICGRKCMKPVFTEEDYKKSVFGDKKEHREKRNLETQEYELNPEEDKDHDHSQCELGEDGKCLGKRPVHDGAFEEEEEEGVERGRSNGKGEKNGKGDKRGKGKGKGLEHGKGAENGKGEDEEGVENGRSHGKGKKHAKGAKRGKGKGKGLEHAKGDDNGKEEEEEGVEHGRSCGKGKKHGKGAKHGKGKAKGLEHGKGAENGNEEEEEGAEHGRSRGKGKKHGKGAKHGKGKGKGLEHGKGAEDGDEEDEEGVEHGRSHGKGKKGGKGAKNGKGHGKGLEHGKGAKNGKGHGKENDSDHEESLENRSQAEEPAEHLRTKRFAKNKANNDNNGKNKCKAKKNKKRGKGETDTE